MEHFGFDKLPDAVKLLIEKLDRIETLLLNLKPADDTGARMLNVSEAAAFLNITVSALYTLVNRRSIPVNKPGKRLYFDKDELTEWIRAGKQKTSVEIEIEAAKKNGPYHRRLNR